MERVQAEAVGFRWQRFSKRIRKPDFSLYGGGQDPSVSSREQEIRFMIRKLTSLPFCIPLALLAMLVMTTRSSATDKQLEARTSATETPGFSSLDKSGGQCRAPIVGDVTRSELQGLATVERSLPGTWRRGDLFRRSRDRGLR